MVVYFKDWADIKSHYDKHFGITGLTPAEQELKDAVASGEPCILDKTYPTDIAECLPPEPDDWSKPDPTHHIRADVLRFVLLQEIMHNEMTEAGSRLYGAQITGSLDLSDATIFTYCGLTACRFENVIEANRAQFQSHSVFRHSTLPALSAVGATIAGQLGFTGARFEATNGMAVNLQGAQIGGGVFLSKITAVSTIDIKGATITGPLDCTGARFKNSDENSLNLQGTQIGDGLFLRNITAASTIDIRGVTITGPLACEGARFVATDKTALTLQGAQIGDGFYFRKVQEVKGRIHLNGANVTRLVDSAASWDMVKDLTLDGFRYESISGDTKPTFAERMEWLEKGSVFKGEFSPQPYTQLADTYKRAGHDREARDVRIALAKKLNEHIRKDLVVVPNGDIKVGFKSAARDIWIGILWCWHKLQLLLTGHGFKPQRALYALIFLVATCWWITHKAWHAGDFAPNSDVILLSEDWGTFESAPNHAKAWEESQAGKDWESFSPIAYAADIVIPIVDFGQTQAWAPSTNRGPWGKRLWWMRWVFTAAGWIISALGAAAITGVIRRE